MWGDANDKSTISCNNKTISVPRNLAEGLKTLRRPDRLRILWADALCINQKDLEERGSQVALMARIFSEASRVLIWLGHGDSDKIQTACSYICRYLNHQEDYCLAKYYWNLQEIQVDGAVTLDQPPDDVEIAALEQLFTCPYFLRGWIIQEIVLPKTAELSWGRARINYLWISEFTRKLRDPYSTYFTALARSGMEGIDEIRRIRYALHDTPKQFPFTELLMSTSSNIFTDPRDYIYGLLGLQKICRDMTLQRPLFQPDYTLDYIECHKSAIETLLVDRGDLCIVSLQYYRDVITDDRPSWVPPLGRSSESRINAFYYEWRAGGYLEATISRQTSSSYDCMRIRGLRAGIIRSRTVRWPRDPEVVQEMLRNLELRHGECRVAWTMTHGSSVSRYTLHRQPLREEEHMEAYRRFVHPESTGDQSHDLRADPFCRRSRESLSWFTLFVTDDDLLGIGQGPAKPGDQVVVFFGGRMPFLLRPVGPRWRLLGVCFIHGIMEGELVKRMKHDARYMAEDFDIF